MWKKIVVFTNIEDWKMARETSYGMAISTYKRVNDLRDFVVAPLKSIDPDIPVGTRLHLHIDRPIEENDKLHQFPMDNISGIYEK